MRAFSGAGRVGHNLRQLVRKRRAEALHSKRYSQAGLVGFLNYHFSKPAFHCSI
jgi:hypothetical protein